MKELDIKELIRQELADREIEKRKFIETGDILKKYEIEGFNTKLLTVGSAIKLRINGYEIKYLIRNTDIDKIELIEYTGSLLTLHIIDFDKREKSYYEILEIL